MKLKISIIKNTFNKKIIIFTNIIKTIHYKYNICKYCVYKSYILDTRKELKFNDIMIHNNNNNYNLIIKLVK